jgi:hypothetical protein
MTALNARKTKEKLKREAEYVEIAEARITAC